MFIKDKICIDEIRSDKEMLNNFIAQHTNFVLSSASKNLGRFITKEDEEFSVALLAFNEAIEKYEKEKGDFFAFSALMIKNRIIDDLRRSKSKPIPFSSLSRTNNEGNVEEFEVVGSHDVVTETALEFETLKKELGKYGISMMDLTKNSPKSRKTKDAVFDVLCFIKNSEEARVSLLKKQIMPSKIICEALSVKQKLLERHKPYIIAATVILTDDYPIISQYINNLKGV